MDNGDRWRIRSVARIYSLTAAEARDAIKDLTRVLQDAVASGVSLGFAPPLDDETARRYWRRVIAEIEAGDRVLLAARDEDGALLGSAQLNLATPPNARHRAEVQKVCVLRSARGTGIGAQLMLAIEEAARAAGRTLLVLDTRKDGLAEGFYRRLGYREAGAIPGYARTVDGSFVTTVFFYRTLDEERLPAGAMGEGTPVDA
jgi:ribosomal protein S18 acetylase RimI-like enzyme